MLEFTNRGIEILKFVNSRILQFVNFPPTRHSYLMQSTGIDDVRSKLLYLWSSASKSGLPVSGGSVRCACARVEKPPEDAAEL
jgi:hypothetical protein